MRYLLLFLLCSIFFSCEQEPSSATEGNSMPSFKRSVPAEVLPVTVEGVRYSATMNEIVATDTLNNHVLWKEEIYKVIYDKELERDVQDIYISSLSVNEGSLIIGNENEELYSLNLGTKEVKKK